MKVYSVIIFNNNNSILEQIHDVYSFGFFERSSIREFFIFVSRTMNKKTEYNKRITFNHEGYNVSCYKNLNLGIVIITDLEYPERPLFSFINELINNYTSGENVLNETLLKRIQDPKNYDKISKVQDQLDETLKVMHDTIDKVLDRGEKLDDLVEKSSDLSLQSKAFYKQAKKHNSCCSIS